MIFFLEPKIEWQKKNLRFKWIGKFIDFDRIKKKKGNLCGTSISVWVRCERFQVSVEIKAKNEAKDVLDSSSSFRLKTPSTQAVKDRMIMLQTV